MLSDAELVELKSRPDNDCAVIAGRWVTLRRQRGRSGHAVGPCPLCSKNPHSKKDSRFETKDGGQAWVCGACGDGGDVIRLVMRHEGLDFRGAVDWLGGSRQIDPAEAAKRDREREEEKKRKDAEADSFRQRERGVLYDIWRRALPAKDSPVEHYLKLRKLELPDGAWLRFIPAMPYFAHGGKDAAVLHRGPVMAAPIVRGGKFSGLHFTWIDLGNPKGKPPIIDPETKEPLSAKKVRGSKSGGHIELAKVDNPTQLVIGEGIETVLTVWLAMKSCGIDISSTAFWSAVDLGNLGGAASATIAHPTLRTGAGRPQRVPGPHPDLDKPGIVIPPSVRDAVLLGDGDSDPVITECALYRGQVRFAGAHSDRDEGCAARVVRVAMADVGMDFNDMLMSDGVLK